MGLLTRSLVEEIRNRGIPAEKKIKKHRNGLKQDYQLKEQGLENVLGKMHDVVG